MLPFSTPHFTSSLSSVYLLCLFFFFGAILSYSYSFDPKVFVSCCSCLVLDSNSWLNVSSEASFLLCPNCLPLLPFRLTAATCPRHLLDAKHHSLASPSLSPWLISQAFSSVSPQRLRRNIPFIGIIFTVTMSNFSSIFVRFTPWHRMSSLLGRRDSGTAFQLRFKFNIRLIRSYNSLSNVTFFPLALILSTSTASEIVTTFAGALSSVFRGAHSI